MKELKTEILINTTPQKVWEILVDFKRYHEWNPFIKSITGNVVVGSKITARFPEAGIDPTCK
jgi:uncharacterized protein YndB with AHSA1/START domain